MRVQLLVTKTDFNLPNIENELKDLDINYDVEYVEEHPELVSALNIRTSPQHHRGWEGDFSAATDRK